MFDLKSEKWEIRLQEGINEFLYGFRPPTRDEWLSWCRAPFVQRIVREGGEILFTQDAVQMTLDKELINRMFRTFLVSLSGSGFKGTLNGISDDLREKLIKGAPSHVQTCIVRLRNVEPKPIVLGEFDIESASFIGAEETKVEFEWMKQELSLTYRKPLESAVRRYERVTASRGASSSRVSRLKSVVDDVYPMALDHLIGCGGYSLGEEEVKEMTDEVKSLIPVNHVYDTYQVCMGKFLGTLQD